MTHGKSVALCAAIAAAVVEPLSAAPTRVSHLGQWRIVSSEPAPWRDPKDPGTAPFPDRISGWTVTFTRTRIAAPPPLGCRRPRYALKQVPPEGLFQGGLTSAIPQAAALGFRGRAIRTLETGCSGWLDFHFRDADTALFALDNRIYTLRRQRR